MKKISVLFISLLLLFCLSLGMIFPVSAEVFTHQAAGVEIYLPDDWYHSIDGDDIEVESPDEEVSLVMTVMEGNQLDEALSEIISGIMEALGPLDLDEHQQHQINGLDVVSVEGRAINVPVEVSITLYVTPQNKVFAIFGFATAEAIMYHKTELVNIFYGIKSLKSESASQPSVAVSHAPWAPEDFFTVSGTSVALRNQPNTKSKVVIRLGYDDYGTVLAVGPVEKIGKYGSNYWIKVRIDSRNNAVGWIYGYFMQAEVCSN